MVARTLSRLTLALSCLGAQTLVPAAALADDLGTTVIEDTNEAPRPESVRIEVDASRAHNRTKSNGAASSNTDFSELGVSAKTRYDKFGVLLDVSRLERETEIVSIDTDVDKTTTRLTPGLSYHPNERWSLSASHQMIRTSVENSMVSEDYKLNAGRTILEASYFPSRGESLTVTAATEARAEEEYAVGPYPMIDRDYVPAQLEVAYVRPVLERLDVNGAVRYSHYNHDIYKDQYDSDVPSTPTIAQVFDYLLSFRAGARYALTRAFGLSAGYERKAALDTNAYTGDEYLVGNTARLGFDAAVGEHVTAGAEYATSSGRKTHEVSGEEYDYANRFSSVQASLGIKM